MRKANLPLRVALVFYRDIGDDTAKKDAWRFKVRTFTRSVEDAKVFLADVAVGGLGRDFPEDLAGGLAQALALSWRSATRLVVHIGDAPPHGAEYHVPELGDENPAASVELPRLVSTLAARGIDYYFVKLVPPPEAVIAYPLARQLKDSMDLMAAKLEAAYKAGNPHQKSRMKVTEVRASCGIRVGHACLAAR